MISIPMYSAELHPSNKSQQVRKQLKGVETAVADENNKLRISRINVEVLNQYNNLIIDMEGEKSTRIEKLYNLWMKHIPTTPQTFNVGFIRWTIVFGICIYYHL